MRVEPQGCTSYALNIKGLQFHIHDICVIDSLAGALLSWILLDKHILLIEMPITLYYHPLSQPSRAVLALLAIGNVPYEGKLIDLFKG